MTDTARSTERFFWIALYILSPVIPIAFYFAGNWFSFFHGYSISMTFGIVAYIYYLNQFIVAARPGYWDRLYGLDRMYKFHANMAITATLFAIGHGVMKSVYFPVLTVQLALGSIAFLVFFLVVVVSLVFMVENSLSKLKPIRRLKNVAANKWRWHYHRLKTFHNLVVLAMFAVLAHVLLAFSTLETFVRIVLMALWFTVSLGYYIWHKIWRPAVNKRKPFTVSDVTAETKEIVSFSLATPPEREFKYRAGQFAYFRFLDGVPGPEEHPFTISSAPGAGEVRVTAKALGDFTGDLGLVKPGAAVAVDGPYGVFTIKRIPQDRPIVCIAGGIGITPFLSILADLADSGESRSVALLWSIRHGEELFSLTELGRFKDAIGTLRVELFLTGKGELPETNGFPIHRGRANLEKLHELGLVDPGNAYYLCGPGAMMESIIKDLRKTGVPGGNFHFEAFAM